MMVIINIKDEKLEVSSNAAKEFFENNQIDESISTIFKEAKKDHRTFFELTPDEESKLNSLKINESDFDTLAKPVIDSNLICTHITQPPNIVNLFIKQPDFIGNSKWVFIYNKTIKASIKDEIFLNEIKTGKIKLGAGYQLNCSLQLEYDLENMSVIKKGTEKYTILKVIKVLEPKQQELFLNQ